MDEQREIERLVEQYSGLILTICYSMTGDYFEAEDLTQETFAAAFRGMERFDGENPKAWLCRIASNRCKDYLKSAARRIRPAPDESFGDLADRSPLPEEEVLAEDERYKMKQICGELKEPYRSVALAHFVDCLSAKEIALKTGKNVKTVQTQIYRIRGMLRKQWKEAFG